MRTLITRFVLTPFGLATLACLGLAGWALWSGGIVDTAVARDVRTSSVYAAPGVDLDEAAAERVIGYRHLVVIIMSPADDLGDTCDDVKRAAAGTLVVLLKADGDDDVDTYGCSTIDGGTLGRRAVVETTVSDGVDAFAGRWIDAVKVIVVNYDQLVNLGYVPDGARTISPSLPRFLIAGAALGGVVLGSLLLFVAARRAGRAALATHTRREDATDSRTQFSAAAAVVAQQIIDLDQDYQRALAGKRVTAPEPAVPARGAKRAKRRSGGTPNFASRYHTISAEYAKLFTDVAEADERRETDYSPYIKRAEDLSARLRALIQ